MNQLVKVRPRMTQPVRARWFASDVLVLHHTRNSLAVLPVFQHKQIFEEIRLAENFHEKRGLIELPLTISHQTRLSISDVAYDSFYKISENFY